MHYSQTQQSLFIINRATGTKNISHSQNTTQYKTFFTQLRIILKTGVIFTKHPILDTPNFYIYLRRHMASSVVYNTKLKQVFFTIPLETSEIEFQTKTP